MPRPDLTLVIPVLNEEAVRAGAQTDLDERGIAKNAREEKLKARNHKDDALHHEEMAKLYRQHVLKEQPTIQIQGLGGRRGDSAPGSTKKTSEPAPVLHKPVI